MISVLQRSTLLIHIVIAISTIFVFWGDALAACPSSVGGVITVNGPITSGCNLPAGESLVVGSTGNISGSPSGWRGVVEILGASSTITNNGVIGDLAGTNGVGLGGSGASLVNLQNNGTISSQLGQYAISNPTGAILGQTISGVSSGGITNGGTIDGIYQTAIGNGGWINSVINTSSGSIVSQLPAIENWGVIKSIQNSNLIQSRTDSAIINRDYTFYGFDLSVIETIQNNVGGAISGATIPTYLPGHGIDNQATIGTIINLGTITGGTDGYGIRNTGSGTISQLTNAQGAGNPAGALTYNGTLPTNYNIVINSLSSFGRLAVSGAASSTSFGVSTLSATSAAILGSYTSVITGVTNTQLGVTGTTKSGISNGYRYTLRETTSTPGSEVWSLDITSVPTPEPTPTPVLAGPSVANTNASLQNAASILQGVYALQNSVISNSFFYDCDVFGVNNVCVSAGGRNTAVSATNGLNNSSALLIAGYRISSHYRIGAFADQNLSVNNAGTGLLLGNNTPLVGVFGVWNESANGVGAELKVSAAYGQKNTTFTRSVVGSGPTASEAGSGSSQLNSQGGQITVKYGFAVADETVVSPYFGMRYTQNNMGGYTEGASSAVTAPLTYSAINTNAGTALAGASASYRGIPKTILFASAGVESDTNTANGSLSATNSSIGALASANLNVNPVRTRPTAMLGGYYSIEKNQRLGITGIYRQESYQAISTTTLLATYTIGL